MDKAQRKILRSPSLKRKSKVLPVNQRVTLERVLGLTVSSSASLSCDSNSGTIAYPAGCVLVLFNPRKNRQTHIFNVVKKTITCVAFSGDGKHIVTGESGHQPGVRVWDVEEKTQVAEFHGHKFAINCVAFSPNLKYLVSIGSQHDMMVNVWNWRTGNKVASNKISSKVSAVAFSADGSYFITVGNRHVKFWYLDSSRSKVNETVPLQGRSGILGDQKNNYFCGVCCGQGKGVGRSYVITQSGLLCEFNEKRLLDKWVELRTKSANCVCAGEDYIFIGCGEGVVRVFNAQTLHFVATLPHPHFLGVEISSAVSPNHMSGSKEDAKYPDTIAIAFDDNHKKVTCVYNDHSLYIWDVMDVKRVGKAWSFLFHSSCIWGLEMYPELEDESTALLPPNSFLTCSSDDTIRVWNLDPHMPEKTAYKRNIYSNDLLKIMYNDPTHAYLCDVDYNPAGGADKTDTTYDGKNGVRSIRISPDGQQMASGDRMGNIRIYDMQLMTEVRTVEAHDADVMCLEYSFSKAGPKLLASASRDRLLHVFDVEQDYGLLQTLDDHSATITAIRFTDSSGQLKMVSCSSDKSILFRNATMSPDFQFALDQHLVSKCTMYDMVIDPTQKFVATACQDRNIRIYNIRTAKQKKNYKGSLTDDGILLRVQLDPSGSYAATSSSDKNICLLDFFTGELMATMYGHSEVITGVKFTSNLKHVISTSADGCIMVWRLPLEMTHQMRSRLEELGKMPPETHFISDFRRETSMLPNPVLLEQTLTTDTFPVTRFVSPGKVLDLTPASPDSAPDYRFSVGPLPNWAKGKTVAGGQGKKEEEEGVPARGRWAQRVDPSLTVKSQLDGRPTDIPDGADRRRLAYEGEALQTQLAELRRETMVLGRPASLQNIPIIDDDDNVNNDDDEGFFPAYLSSRKDTFNLDGKGLPRQRKMRARFRLDTQSSSGPRGGGRTSGGVDRSLSLDLDEEGEGESGSDAPEVIYYPASETDSNDAFPSSYRVFAISNDDLPGSKSRRQSSLKFGGLDGNFDEDSESTDPVSLEDAEEDAEEGQGHSHPSTPSDPDREFLRTPDREKFVKENFGDVTFTSVASGEHFQRALDHLEQDLGAAAQPFSPRLSLSARFLSRVSLRNPIGNIQRQDNWFDPLQRSKTEMARAVDETRKKLLAMGWNTEEETTSPDRKPDSPPSPPTRLSAGMDLKKTDFDEGRFSTLPRPAAASRASRDLDTLSDPGADDFPVNTSKPPKSSMSPARTSLSSRRRSDADRQRSASKDSAHRLSSECELNKAGTRPGLRSFTTGQRSSGSSGGANSASYQRPTKSSKAKVLRSNSSSNLPSSTGAGGASGLSRAVSMSSLTSSTTAGRSSSAASASSSSGSSMGPAKRRLQKNKKSSSPSLSKAAQYASTPNLAVCLEEEEESLEPLSNLQGMADLSLSVPDIGDMDTASCSTESSGDRSNKSSPRRSQWSKGDISGHSTPIPRSLSVFGSHSTLAKQDDTALMPPPAGPVNRAKHDGFMRKATQARRRTTPSQELTLDQAKDILLGRSGLLPRKDSGESQDPPSPTQKLLQSARKTSSDSTLTSPSILNSSRLSTSSTSSTVFDSDIADARTLSTAEEIERTAAELRHQAASPNDLPERDTPSKVPYSSRNSLPGKGSLPTSTAPSPSSAHFPVKSKGAPSLVFSSSQDVDVTSRSRSASVEMASEGEEAPTCLPSIKDRIKQYNCAASPSPLDRAPSPMRRGSTSSESSPRMSRSTGSITTTTVTLTTKSLTTVAGSGLYTVTPSRSASSVTASMSGSVSSVSSVSSLRDTRTSPRSQDTGLGSDTDTDSEIRRPDKTQSHPPASLVTSANDLNSSVSLANPVVAPLEKLSPRADRSKLSLPVSASTLVTSSQDALEACDSFVSDFNSLMKRAKELLEKVSQADDTTSRQAMRKLGQMFHEAHATFADLAASTPSPPLESGQTSKCGKDCVLGSDKSSADDSLQEERVQELLNPILLQISSTISDSVWQKLREKKSFPK